jgi:hypothetical protein
MQLSDNFTLAEMTRSQTAARFGLDNTPDEIVITNLRNLTVIVLEQIRTLLGVPLAINSGYRSIAVNRKVGGAKTSQHVKGEAADFVPVGMSVEEAFRKIAASGIPFDQLIEEGTWIHISYRTSKPNRRQILRANFTAKGKVSYVEV